MKFEYEKELSIEQNLIDLRSKVDSALARIEAGGYGNCERCGEAIPKARLDALPYSTLLRLLRQPEVNRRYSIAVGIAAVVVFLDLITKRYAALHFADAPVVVIPNVLGFTYTENPGAAFSSLQGSGPWLGLAAIAITLFLLYTLRLERPTLEVVAFGFVLGGALGNLADRIFRGDAFLDGFVIDWINLWFIPTFNLADTSITIAVVLLIIDAWRRR